jgi:dienelactone hydrolase
MQILVIVLLALPALAQVPATDARWDVSKGTRYEFPMPQYASKADWEARKAHLRKQIRAAAGLLPAPARPAVRSSIFGKLEREGYSIEKVWVETMPGYYLGGNLYRPRGRSGKFPGILSPHGHWKSGRLEDSAIGSIPARCINLARMGYVVFAYDMVGYNDTKQTPHVFGKDADVLWNFNPFSLQTWNSLRALDFLESLPDVDRQRLGVTGASGGGTQTFILAALDDRVKVDVPVNMVSGIMQGGSPCENAPGLRHEAINVDFAAMMAPRPMLLVSATGDWTKNVPKNEYPAIRKIYELYDAASRVEVVQYDSPHNYHKDSRESMYTFFARQFLGGDGSRILEQPYQMEKPEDLLVWHDRQMPQGARDYDGVAAAWKDLTRVRTPDRETLRYALSVEVPAAIDAQILDAGGIVLSRRGKGDRVAGLWREGKGPARIVVHPDGKEAAESAEPAGERSTLYLDVWNTGSSKGIRDTKVNHFYTFHRTDDQNRVQDILTALAWLRQKHGAKVELHGFGDAALWVAFAGAVSGAPVRADLKPFTGTDEEMVAKFFVPGIQRVGGLDAARRLATMLK